MLLMVLSTEFPINILEDEMAYSMSSVSEQFPSCGELQSAFANDEDMRELLQEFVAAMPERVAIIQRLLNEENLIDLRRAVHQLKSSSGGYGFEIISRLAAVAEHDLKQQEPLDRIKADIDSLVALVRSVAGYRRSQEEISHV
jgi:HPt (histidine-containing phosphotransfer) domain-containing protein